MASPCLKRKQSQPCSQGGVFGLSPKVPTPCDGRKKNRKDKLTWVRHTRTPYFDGHLWRKYGQKTIKNAPCPRLYFRCSYREDRQCLASKLVQQVSHDDLPLYEVTYMYEHTCNAEPVPTPDGVVHDEPPAASGGLVLSFSSSSGGHDHRDAGMQPREERQQWHQSAPSPFLTTNLDYSNNNQQHALIPSHVVPTPTTSSWSPSSFPIIESSSPTTPWTVDIDDILTWDWDSFTCDFDDDHLQFGDHVKFPGSSFSWSADGSSLAHLGVGIEADGVTFLISNS